MPVPPFLPVAQEAAGGRDTEIVLIGPPTAGVAAFAYLLQHAGEPPAVRLDPAIDLALQPYSSGTSGLPKGVMLTHRALVANVLSRRAPIPFRDDDRVLAVAPFFHAVGFGVVANGALHGGATVVTMPRFDVAQFLELIERHRITTMIVVPPIVLALAKHPAVDDARPVGRCGGSAAAPPRSALRCSRPPPSASAARCCRAGDDGDGRRRSPSGGSAAPIVPGAAGMLFPGVDARVVDLAGRHRPAARARPASCCCARRR